jgi:hypothetical protein
MGGPPASNDEGFSNSRAVRLGRLTAGAVGAYISDPLDLGETLRKSISSTVRQLTGPMAS